jgi:hypothetical protein
METFPIVKRKDEKAHGEYRTKRVILEMYDQMAEASRTGIPIKTWLDPPPANGWTPPAELIEEALRSIRKSGEEASDGTPNKQSSSNADGRGRGGRKRVPRASEVGDAGGEGGQERLDV